MDAPEISNEAKSRIDSLSSIELLYQIVREHGEKFDGPEADYALARYRELKDLEETQFKEETLNAANEANDIAAKSNSWSKGALFIATLALLLSLWHFLHDIFSATRPG